MKVRIDNEVEYEGSCRVRDDFKRAIDTVKNVSIDGMDTNELVMHKANIEGMESIYNEFEREIDRYERAKSDIKVS